MKTFLLKNLPILLTVLFQLNVYAAPAKDSVMNVRVRYAALNLSDVPEYRSYEEVKSAFEYVRDTKFLTYEGEARRIPWLFIKDFCQSRAHHVVRELAAAGFVKPKKVFLHGILNMKNKYFELQEGEMIWQHIAPIVSVKGIHYVLDPAIDQRAPMKLDQWINSLTQEKDKALLAICSGDTYLQTSSCYNPEINSHEEEMIELDTYWSLRLEWNTVKYFGDDPQEVLLK